LQLSFFCNYYFLLNYFSTPLGVVDFPRPALRENADHNGSRFNKSLYCGTKSFVAFERSKSVQGHPGIGFAHLAQA